MEVERVPNHQQEAWDGEEEEDTRHRGAPDQPKDFDRVGSPIVACSGHHDREAVRGQDIISNSGRSL